MKRINVLDHGYVEYVEHWGSDERIIESARMSTQKGFEGWGPVFRCKKCKLQFQEDQLDPNNVCGYKCSDDSENHDWNRDQPGDEKLLAFLWKNAHATPFEMAGLIIEVQAPIFIFREWHRHRTQSYNEMSSRYAPLPDVCFLPDVKDAVARSERASKKNKQAGLVDDAEVLTEPVAFSLLHEEEELLKQVESLYQRKLKAGFTKELARTHLTVSRYSKMRAQANLRNWLGFLTLRNDSKAQWEIQQYARAVQTVLKEKFPRTVGLFEEGRK